MYKRQVLFCLLAGDLLTSLAALLQLNTSLKEPSELSLRLRRLTDHLDNAVTRYIQRRMARAYGLRRERLEEQARRRAAKKGTSGVFAPVSYYREKGLYKYTYGENTDYNKILRMKDVYKGQYV